MKGRDVFTTIRTEGGLLPVDLLQRIASSDTDIDGLTPEAYHLAEGERLNEIISRSWNRLLGAWTTFRSHAEQLPESDSGTTLTRERWLLILFQELGYGRLQPSKSIEIEGKSYSISHAWKSSPIHLIGFKVELDRRTAGVAGAARMSPHSMVQEFLNRSEKHLWAFLSNGLRLRILRDNSSMTRQAYVEFDIEGMMEGETYPDFVLLWLLCHQSRVEADIPEQCWLEQWTRTAEDIGTRVLDRLRDGVEQAISFLGSGFLACQGNSELREHLRFGNLSTQDYYRQLLRLVYRLIFLFAAEDRGLLLRPGAGQKERERYDLFYSTSRIRALAERMKGTKHIDIYQGLRVVMNHLGSIDGCPSLGLPALGSFLWSEDALPDLMYSNVENKYFLDAVRSLAFTIENKIFRSIDYKNLGSDELGSVYESLLELHPEINTEASTFELKSASGHERKTTGSYYTPSSLIQCLLDSALDPALNEACKKSNPEKEILALKVCDPACGSGHFLIAAAHRMAKKLATVRSGEEEPAPEIIKTALRDIIGHCIYGVDLNSMAVELCKINLWMEALEPGKPLSFLDHRIQCGNSFIGTTPAHVDNGIPDEAFKPIECDNREFANALKKQNKKEKNQMSMFGAFASESHSSYDSLGSGFLKFNGIDDSSIEGVLEKQVKYEHLKNSNTYKHELLIANAWCAAFLWNKIESAPPPITEDILRRLLKDAAVVSKATIAEIKQLSKKYCFFHWHLAFPDIFMVNKTEEDNLTTGWSGGFDVVLGNPPWDVLQSDKPDVFDEQHERIKLWSQFNEYSILKGRRDLYKLFIVMSKNIIAANGVVAFIVPVGIFIEDDCSDVRKKIFIDGSVLRLQHFQNNRKQFFPDVHASYRFVCIFFSRKPGTDLQFSTVIKSPDQIKLATWLKVPHNKLTLQLGDDLGALLFDENKYALTHNRCLNNLTKHDLLKYYVIAEFHASTDKKLFKENNDSNKNWGLLKNKCIHQFNYHFALPEKYIDANEVNKRCKRKNIDITMWTKNSKRLLFRDIARNDDARTLICCVAPEGYVSSYDTPMVIPEKYENNNLYLLLGYLCGVFNSFLYDFLIRPSVDKHIKGYILTRLPVPEPDFNNYLYYWLSKKSLELNGLDIEDNASMIIRAQIDALCFHLFNIQREDIDYIMETFPIVKRKDKQQYSEYRTKRLILEIYDAMIEAQNTGNPYQSMLDPLPVDSSVAHADN